MPAKDLHTIMDDWPYEPGQINVRKIRGNDNHIKIQMRVNLGILQMEIKGRPDGSRPYNHESLLEYHRERVEAHNRNTGTDLDFALDPEECQAIREETFQYYQRYLANFVLEDYEAVAKDTKRNLEVLDFCRQYAAEEEDQYLLEPYRPYIVMMHVRSQAMLAMEKGHFRTALNHIEAGLRQLKVFYRQFGQPGAYRESSEAEVLRALRREIRRHVPQDPIRKARKMLDRAVREERYEDAARLRDELENLQAQRKGEGSIGS